MSRPHPVVLFDGVCNLCNWTARHIIRHDPSGRFRLASLQSRPGRDLVAQYGVDPDTINTVVLVENGNVYTKSDAALMIARRLRGPSQFLWPMRFLPRPIRDAAYDWVSRNRYQIFGKREECMIPGSGIQERFLDGGELPVELAERPA